jgi:ubiquinone/menaquinone biosynthesis C-methylase UbiE
VSNVRYDKVGRDFDAVRDRQPAAQRVWLDHVARYLPEPPPAAVADVGAGTGIWSQAIAVRFGCTVYGVEPSAGMLARARQAVISCVPRRPVR